MLGRLRLDLLLSEGAAEFRGHGKLKPIGGNYRCAVFFCEEAAAALWYP